MAYNTRQLRREGNPPSGQLASPVPQYWNPSTEAFEDVLGAHGAPRSILYGPNGQPISQSNPLEVRVRELEAELAAMRGMLETGNAKVTLSGSKTLISSAPVTGVKTVTGIAAEIFAGSSRKSGRSLMMIRNLATAVRIRVGASSVTDQTGFGIEPEAVLTLAIDPGSDVPVYAVSEAGDVQVEVFEA